MASFKKHILIAGRNALVSLTAVCCSFGYLIAQYTENPLKDVRWMSMSVGANTADHVSWQTGITYSTRGETLLTQMRIMYSQELIEAPDDSIFFRKNKLAEFALMWGDGWGGKNW